MHKRKKASLVRANLLDLPYDCLGYITNFFLSPYEVNSFVRSCRLLHDLLFNVEFSSCENVVFFFKRDSGDTYVNSFHKKVFFNRGRRWKKIKMKNEDGSLFRYPFVHPHAFKKDGFLSPKFYPYVRTIYVFSSFLMELHADDIREFLRFPNVIRVCFDTSHGRKSEPLIHGGHQLHKVLSPYKYVKELICTCYPMRSEWLASYDSIVRLKLSFSAYASRNIPFPVETLAKMKSLKVLTIKGLGEVISRIMETGELAKVFKDTILALKLKTFSSLSVLNLDFKVWRRLEQYSGSDKEGLGGKVHSFAEILSSIFVQSSSSFPTEIRASLCSTCPRMMHLDSFVKSSSNLYGMRCIECMKCWNPKCGADSSKSDCFECVMAKFCEKCARKCPGCQLNLCGKCLKKPYGGRRKRGSFWNANHDGGPLDSSLLCGSCRQEATCVNCRSVVKSKSSFRKCSHCYCGKLCESCFITTDGFLCVKCGGGGCCKCIKSCSDCGKYQHFEQCRYQGWKERVFTCSSNMCEQSYHVTSLCGDCCSKKRENGETPMVPQDFCLPCDICQIGVFCKKECCIVCSKCERKCTWKYVRHRDPGCIRGCNGTGGCGETFCMSCFGDGARCKLCDLSEEIGRRDGKDRYCISCVDDCLQDCSICVEKFCEDHLLTCDNCNKFICIDYDPTERKENWDLDLSDDYSEKDVIEKDKRGVMLRHCSKKCFHCRGRFCAKCVKQDHSYGDVCEKCLEMSSSNGRINQYFKKTKR